MRHDDAELREVHDVFRALADEAEGVRTDEDAGHGIAEDGAEAEAFGDGDGDDRGDQVNEGLGEGGIHRRLGGQRVRGEGRWVRRRGR